MPLDDLKARLDALERWKDRIGEHVQIPADGDDDEEPRS